MSVVKPEKTKNIRINIFSCPQKDKLKFILSRLSVNETVTYNLNQCCQPKEFVKGWGDKLRSWHKVKPDEIVKTFTKDFKEIFGESIYITEIFRYLKSFIFSEDNSRLVMVIQDLSPDFSPYIPWELLIRKLCKRNNPIVMYKSNNNCSGANQTFQSHFGYVCSNKREKRAIEAIAENIQDSTEQFLVNNGTNWDVAAYKNREINLNKLYGEEDVCDSRLFYFHIRNSSANHPFVPGELERNRAHTRTCAIIPFSDERSNGNNWTPAHSLEFADAANNHCMLPLLGISLLKPIDIKSCGQVSAAIAMATQKNHTVIQAAEQLINHLEEHSPTTLDLLILSGTPGLLPFENLKNATEQEPESSPPEDPDIIRKLVENNNLKAAIDKLKEFGLDKDMITGLTSKLNENNKLLALNVNVEERMGKLSNSIMSFMNQL